MSEERHDSQVDINELLSKYLPDEGPEDGAQVEAASNVPDPAQPAEDKGQQRHRRRTASRRDTDGARPRDEAGGESVVYDRIEDFEPNGVAADGPDDYPTGIYEASSAQNVTGEADDPGSVQGEISDVSGEKSEPDASMFAEYGGEGDDPYEGVAAPEEHDGSGETDENFEKLDDFDMNILLALGMEDELENTVGEDRVNRFVSKQQTELDKTVSVNRERAELEYEYTAPTQTREIAERYQRSYRASKLKLLGAALLTLALFMLECGSMFGITLSGPFDKLTYPVVYIMAGLQLALIIAAFAWKSLFNGFKNFFRGKPTPECVACFALLFDVIYSAAISFCDSFGETGPETFNLPVAVGFLLLYVYELINLRREIMSFGIISSKKKKCALASLSMAESHLEHEAFSDLMDEDDKAEDISVLKVEGADFVGDYFLRTNRYAGGRKFIGFIIPAVLVASAAFFAYSYSGVETLYNGLHAAASVALTCLPISVFYMFSDPLYRAVKKANEDDCTIVGESSVEEYADAAIISFDDKNVFPSTGVTVRGINVFGNNRIDRVLYTAASVFCTVGGPLSDVFDLATRDIGHSDDVTVERCLPGLLDVTVEGKNVMFGSIDAIAETGIHIPRPLEEHKNDDFGDNISVMYMVENGKFVSRMLIQYNVDTDFEFTLKQLDKSGMFIGIRTFDPNVTEEFLGRQVRLKKYPVRVIRCKSLDDRTIVADTSVSGLVSTDSPKTLLQTVTLCEKVLHARSVNTMLVIISLFVSLIISALSVLFSAIGLSPLFISLYQLFWIIPMLIVSRMIVS